MIDIWQEEERLIGTGDNSEIDDIDRQGFRRACGSCLLADNKAIHIRAGLYAMQ